MFCTLPCVNLAEVGTKLFHCWSGCSASFQMQPLVYRHFLQYGIHPHAVLSLLKDNWTGFGNLPKSKTVEKYLSDLKETLEKTREFSDKHAKRAQEQYAKFYNTKAVDKSFQICEQVIVLEKDSASKTFAGWQTGEICQKLSPYTYIVSMPNGSRRHLHANKLRKLVVPVTHVGIISENDAEFGEVLAVPVLPDKTGVANLPCQRIDLSSLSHLSEEQKKCIVAITWWVQRMFWWYPWVMYSSTTWNSFNR